MPKKLQPQAKRKVKEIKLKNREQGKHSDLEAWKVRKKVQAMRLYPPLNYTLKPYLSYKDFYKPFST